MKTVFFLLTLGTLSFAATHVSTFKGFVSAVDEANETLENTGDDCSFTVKKLPSGIRLSIDSTDGNVFIYVPSNAKIALNKTYKNDGSFIREFSVRGIGSFMHKREADMKIDVVEIHSSLVDRTLSCGVYY